MISYSDACFCWCCGILLMWWFLAVRASLQQLLSFPPRKNENKMHFCNCRPINEIIKQGVLQPEALLKWLVHARVAQVRAEGSDGRVCDDMDADLCDARPTRCSSLWFSSDGDWAAAGNSCAMNWALEVFAFMHSILNAFIFCNIIDLSALTRHWTWTELIWIITLLLYRNWSHCIIEYYKSDSVNKLNWINIKLSWFE